MNRALIITVLFLAGAVCAQTVNPPPGGSGLPAGGTSSNMLNGTPAFSTALPNGITATTQAAADNSTKVATTAYADASAKAAVAPGAIYTVPLLSSFTQLHFTYSGSTGSTTATQTVSGGAIQLSPIAYNQSTASLAPLLTLAVPATPYKFRAQISAMFAGQNTQIVAFGLTDGTKYEVLDWQSNNGSSLFRIDKWNTFQTSPSSTNLAGSIATSIPIVPYWVQVRNDGTNIYFDLSLDGQNFYSVFTETIATYITATGVVFGGWNGNSATNTFMSLYLLNWYQGSNANLNGP